jgi:hypothetical protein
VAHRSIQNLNVMNLLWAFDFNKDIDSNGNPVEVDTMDYLPVGSLHSVLKKRIMTMCRDSRRNRVPSSVGSFLARLRRPK